MKSTTANPEAMAKLEPRKIPVMTAIGCMENQFGEYQIETVWYK